MAIYPGASFRRVAWADARDDSTTATIAILHLTASEARSQYGYFNSSRKACSHFHVDRAGGVEQYIDSDHISAADGEGSDNAWSIETQGADAGGYWTPEQVESIAQILAWLHKTHGLELDLINTSRVGERGVGWHRIGINGNFPASPSILAGRLQRGGGELWSSARGKVCPGDRRIEQVPGIVARARQIAGAGGGTVPPPAPQPAWKGAMGWPVLRRGMITPEVGMLQRFLGIEDDNSFGPATETAVKDWQRARGLSPDGNVGPATQQAMKNGVKPSVPAKPTPQPKPAGKKNVTGLQAAARAAQDNSWGPDLDRRLHSIRMAAAHHGRQFPNGVAYLQGVLGVAQDGSYGPISNNAHTAATKKVQTWLKANGYYSGGIDGQWGPATDAAFVQAWRENKNY